MPASTAHRLSPIRGALPRWVALLAYDTRQSGLRESRFRLRARVSRQQGRIRSDLRNEILLAE
jgi:hypothetical protein